MSLRRSALVCLLILISLFPYPTSAQDPEDIFLQEESSYNYEQEYGLLLFPLSAIDGNVSEDNYTRIIADCLYYFHSNYCESGLSFIRVEYTLSFVEEVDFVNLTIISKTGYLSYADPSWLEMRISVFHNNGTDILWEDDETSGYINSTSWQTNISGPIPIRENGTIGVEFFIQTDPFDRAYKDVEIRLNEIISNPVIWGCKDVLANNFSPNVTDLNGSCDYDLDNDGILDIDEVYGCTDSVANNYSPNSTEDNGSCDYDIDDDGVLDIDEIYGCTDLVANNFYVNATEDDDSCDYDIDDDGVVDVNDEFPYCDDGGEDSDGDRIPDDCDNFPDDKDNDGASDNYESYCGSNPEDNNSIPEYQYDYCGKLGYLDLGKYCFEEKISKDCINLISKNVGSWELVGLVTFVSCFVVIFRPGRGLIITTLKKREILEVEVMLKQTRNHIENAFLDLEKKLSVNIIDTEKSEFLLNKIDTELESLAFQLKKYIDDKHTQDLLNEKIPGDPRVLLRKQVDESKVYTKNQLLQNKIIEEEE